MGVGPKRVLERELPGDGEAGRVKRADRAFAGLPNEEGFEKLWERTRGHGRDDARRAAPPASTLAY